MSTLHNTYKQELWGNAFTHALPFVHARRRLLASAKSHLSPKTSIYTRFAVQSLRSSVALLQLGNKVLSEAELQIFFSISGQI